MNSLQSVLYFQIAWFFIYLMVEHCKTSCLIWKAFQISSIVFYFVQRLFQIYLFWDFNWIYVSWTSIHVNHCVLRYVNCLLYTSVLLTINLHSDQMSVKYLWNWCRDPGQPYGLPPRVAVATCAFHQTFFLSASGLWQCSITLMM